MEFKKQIDRFLCLCLAMCREPNSQTCPIICRPYLALLDHIWQGMTIFGMVCPCLTCIGNAIDIFWRCLSVFWWISPWICGLKLLNQEVHYGENNSYWQFRSILLTNEWLEVHKATRKKNSLSSKMFYSTHFVTNMSVGGLCG